MPVEAFFAAGPVFADAVFVALFVFGFVVARGLFVVNVEYDSPELHATLCHAAVIEAQYQFSIFVAPTFETFVVSVDADQILAPDSQVATSR